MVQKRIKRAYRRHWERDKENPPKFELQERDKELIELIFRHRFAGSPKTPARSGGLSLSLRGPDSPSRSLGRAIQLRGVDDPYISL
jgi:hypothetical protein